MSDPNQNIAILRSLVEESAQCKAITSSDYIYLAGAIQGRTNKHLGVTTLKRIWGYVEGYKSVRKSTLDILAQFVGYQDFETFTNDYCDSPSARSSHRVVSHIHSSADIPVGAQVIIEWNPNRQLTLNHDGNGHYTVVRAANSKVVAGDTFVLMTFIVGQPMVLSNYVHANEAPCAYIIGNKGGLTTVSIIPPDYIEP